jgi:hypothetical protein
MLTSMLNTPVDLTQILLIVLAGIAALYLLLQKQQQQHAQHAPQVVAQPSAEVRALQDSVKLLLEAQQRQAMQPQQPPPTWFQPPQQQPPPMQPQRRSYPQQQQQQSVEEDSPMDVSTSRKPSYVWPPQSQQTAAGAVATPAVPLELLQDLKALQDSVKNLERRNRELNRQLTLTEVSNVVDVEKKYRLPIPVAESNGSLSVQQLNLSASEIETIRAIFNMFDTEQAGEISTRELRALHKQLGEPLTDEEATAAVAELDQEGSGHVTFNKFLIWWYALGGVQFVREMERG